MASKRKAKKNNKRKKQKPKFRKLEQRLRERGLLEAQKVFYQPQGNVDILIWGYSLGSS
ncbi:MAG: hypothetical protein ACE5IW_06275 [bacterium]